MNESLDNIQGKQNVDFVENIHDNCNVEPDFEFEHVIDDPDSCLFGTPLVVDNDKCNELLVESDIIEDENLADELLTKLKDRSARLSRKIDEPISFVYGPPCPPCPTRHGCSGTTDCDWEQH